MLTRLLRTISFSVMVMLVIGAAGGVVGDGRLSADDATVATQLRARLNRIDRVVNRGIADGEMAGCVVPAHRFEIDLP